MIIFLQIIGLIFALTMIYFALLNYKRREIDNLEFYIWVVIWAAVMLIAVFPDFLRTFSRDVLITRLFDLLVIGGIVLVILLSAKAYLTSKKLEKKVERFIRDEALKNVKKGKK